MHQSVLAVTKQLGGKTEKKERKRRLNTDCGLLLTSSPVKAVVQEMALKAKNSSKKRLNFSGNNPPAKGKKRTLTDPDDLENSFEQREIDSIEEPVRKRGRPKKASVKVPVKCRGRPKKKA